MTTQEDISFLRDCLKHTAKQEGNFPNGSPFVKKLWWGNQETIIKVARIFVKEKLYTTPNSIIDFFEKPYKSEVDMETIVVCSVYEKQQETAKTLERMSK